MSRPTPVDLSGGCDCRAVRYKLTSYPLFVHCCHCRWCQRQSGSAFCLNAVIEADRVCLESKKEPVATETLSPSGGGQTIFRCPTCWIAVWSDYGGKGDWVRFIRVGTLDNPGSVPPDIHIYTSTKQAWVVLPPDAVAREETYDKSDCWPAESLERLKELQTKIQDSGKRNAP